jgi:hypothetical protein
MCRPSDSHWRTVNQAGKPRLHRAVTGTADSFEAAKAAALHVAETELQS